MSIYIITAIVLASAAIVVSERVRKILADRRHQSWRRERSASIEQMGRDAALALANDLHARAPGLVKDDREWLVQSVLHNLWERRGRDAVLENHGLVMNGEDRPLYQAPIRARLDDILQALPDGPRPELPVLRWTRDPEGTFVGPVDEEFGVCPWTEGRWLGVRKQTLVECAPRLGLREVSPPLDSIEKRRGGFLACNPQGTVIALWQRGWAQNPSRTFFFDRQNRSWRTDTHEYRSEDEYGGSNLIFDTHRGELVRYGVTYIAAWSAERGWREQPAGVLQLALAGNRPRVLVSDPELAQTLVIDLWTRQIVRASPGGWAIVATLAWPTDLDRWEKFPDFSTLDSLPARFRYEVESQRLVYAINGPSCYTLDLRPALDAAAALDT